MISLLPERILGDDGHRSLPQNKLNSPLQAREAGRQRQLPRVPGPQCRGEGGCSHPQHHHHCYLQLLRLSSGFCSKARFSSGYTSSDVSRKNSELREAGKSPDPQTGLSFSFFFLPKGMWHGPAIQGGLIRTGNGIKPQDVPSGIERV